MLRCFAVLLASAVGLRTVSAEEYFKLVNPDTKKALSVADQSEDAGAKVVLAKDDGSEIQQWKLEKDGEFLKIVNRKTGKVIDVNEASKDEGGSIIQWDEKSDDTDNQRWSWEGGARRTRNAG